MRYKPSWTKCSVWPHNTKDAVAASTVISCSLCTVNSLLLSDRWTSPKRSSAYQFCKACEPPHLECTSLQRNLFVKDKIIQFPKVQLRIGYCSSDFVSFPNQVISWELFHLSIIIITWAHQRSGISSLSCKKKLSKQSCKRSMMYSCIYCVYRGIQLQWYSWYCTHCIYHVSGYRHFP